MIETLAFEAALVLALPLSAGYLVLVWRHFVLKRRPREARNRVALKLALASFPLAGLHLVWLVLTARSSTAAIALYYLPLYASIAAVGTLLLSWSLIVCATTFTSFLRRQAPPPRWLLRFGLAAAILAGMCVAILTIAEQARAVTHASDPRLAADELMALALQQKSGNLAVLAALVDHPNASPELLEHLAGRDPQQMRRPVRSPLWFLGRERSWDTRSIFERVAGNPRTPEATLRSLARDSSPAILAAVAKNPGTPEDVLGHLATKREMEVGLALAANPRAGVEALSRLAEHPNEYVRERVARSSSLPLGALVRLARDPSWLVRGSVARNPATPPEVLTALAGDPDSRVRFYVATNPRTPEAAIGRLSNDPDERVRRYAAQRLEAPESR